MLAPPFTIAQFFGVFADYNAAIWPLQIITYALGILAVLVLWLRWPLANRVIFAVLAITWAVNGIGYHWLYFAEINPIAKGFAAAFIAQSVLFAACALTSNALRFERRRNLRSATGLSVIVYALLIYPLLGYWAGHGWLAGPLFGVAPCPTTIFTIGLLLLARGRWVAWLSIIPILWSLVGLAAALQLGMAEDLSLPVAALALVIAFAIDTRRGRGPLVSVAHRAGRSSP